MKISEEFIEMWIPVFNDFIVRHPNIADQVIDWYPSGQMQIMVRLDDGSRKLYDWLTDRIYNIYPVEDDLSEDQWRGNFALKLRQKLNYHGMTQEELSAKTGISNVTISKYIKGKAMPNAHNLEKISKALKSSMNEFADKYYY